MDIRHESKKAHLQYLKLQLFFFFTSMNQIGIGHRLQFDFDFVGLNFFWAVFFFTSMNQIGIGYRLQFDFDFVGLNFFWGGGGHRSLTLHS